MPASFVEANLSVAPQVDLGTAYVVFPHFSEMYPIYDSIHGIVAKVWMESLNQRVQLIGS